MTEWFEWRDAPAGDFAVLGDPVGHSLSPRMQSAAFAALGLSYRYHAIRVPEPELREAVDHLAGLGYRGLNATVPLKEAAFRWMSSGEELTRRIRAANTLRLENPDSINTDAPGILDVLNENQVGEGPILVLGAGGSSRAALVALASIDRKTAIWNRTRHRAFHLAEELQLPVEVVTTPTAQGFAAILNTTSASLKGERIGIDWFGAVSGALAFDFAYGPGPTPFMEDAAQSGLKAIDGRALLVAQGARSLEWWLGIEAPRSAMLQAVA